MSATNRGGVRSKNDYYKTPAGIVDLLLETYPLSGSLWLDPSAGSGTIGRQIKQFYPDIKIKQIDISDKYVDYEVGSVHVGNFLAYPNNELQVFDGFIMNPPFNLAEEYAVKCLENRISDTVPVIMLQRLGFLESKTRHLFWQRFPVDRLYILSKRPSFTGDGKTDNAGYAWFIWDGSNKRCGGQEIKTLMR